MEQFKRAKVIMLPTENNTYIGKHLDDEIYLSLYTWYLKSLNIPNQRQGQHLYIISDDDIKEGDWFINLLDNSIHQATNWIYVSTCKKIIATTDTSLTIPTHYGMDEELPQPSQQFIEKYIESYNKSEIITDVLVEYENNYDLEYYTPQGGIECCKKIDNWKLKINSKDNTITIKKVKDSWNREELKILFKKHENDVIKYINSSGPNKFPSFNDNWIKENL